MSSEQTVLLVTLEWGTSILLLIFSLILAIKLWEMSAHTLWAMGVDEGKVSEAQNLLWTKCGGGQALNALEYPSFPGNTNWTTWIGSLWKQKNSKRYVNAIFRFYHLMLTCALLLFVGGAIESWIWCRGFGCSMVLLGVFVRSVEFISYRYFLGEVDNVILGLTPEDSRNRELSITPHQVMKRIMKTYLTNVFTIIFVYASLYYNFAKGLLPRERIANVQWNESVVVQSFYFSVTTFTSFGEIVPNGWLIRLVSASEMILAPTLLVLLLSSYFATSSSASNKDA